MYIHTSLGYCVVHNGNMIAFMASYDESDRETWQVASEIDWPLHSKCSSDVRNIPPRDENCNYWLWACTTGNCCDLRLVPEVFQKWGHYWCYSKKRKYLHVAVMWYFYIKRLHSLIASITGNREKVFVCDYLLKKSTY